jgi:hypothetical protein
MNLLGKIGYKISKETAGFLAPLAAVSSTAGKGGDGIADNLAAIYHVPKAVYGIGKAIVMDEGIRSTGFKLMGDLVDIVGTGAQNLVERPIETLGTAAGVWAGTRYAPHMVKGVGKLFSRRDSSNQAESA